MRILLTDGTGTVLMEIKVTVPRPVDTLFVKDRNTRQNYLMIRSCGEDNTKTPRQLVPVRWDRYSGVFVKEIS